MRKRSMKLVILNAIYQFLDLMNCSMINIRDLIRTKKSWPSEYFVLLRIPSAIQQLLGVFTAFLREFIDWISIFRKLFSIKCRWRINCIFFSRKGLIAMYDVTKFECLQWEVTSSRGVRCCYILPSLPHAFTRSCAWLSFQEQYYNTFNFLRDIEFSPFRVFPYCGTSVCKAGLSTWSGIVTVL
jgi:hypothetical protein